MAEVEITKRRSSLIMDGISNWGPMFISIIIGFFLTPYLIKCLGKNRFGVWTLVANFLGYYGLLRLGVGAGIMRYVPYYTGRDEHYKASKAISSGLALFIGVGALIFVVSTLIAEPFAKFYKGGPELAILMRIMGLSAAVECPMRILDAGIRAYEKWVAANFVTIIANVVRAVGLAICAYLGYGVVAMGYVVFGVTVLLLLMTVWMFIRYCPRIHIGLGMVHWDHVRSLVSFGSLVTVITVVSTLRLQGHSLIIGKLMSLEAVAIYGVAAMVVRYVQQAVIAPTRVFWPRFAFLDGENNKEAIATLFKRGTGVVASFSGGMVLLIFTGGRKFISLWVGDGFEGAYTALLVLAAGYFVENSMMVGGTLLGGTGRQGVQALLSSIEGIVGFGLSIFFVWRMNLGLTGVALGFTIAVTLTQGVFLARYICRMYGINLLRYYAECLFWPWLMVFILALTVKISGVLNMINGWIGLILLAMGVSSVYATGIYLLAIDVETKKKIKNGFYVVCAKVLSLSAAKAEG